MYVFHLLCHLLEEQKQALSIIRSQVGDFSTLLVLGFSSGNPTLRGSMPRKPSLSLSVFISPEQNLATQWPRCPDGSTEPVLVRG